MRKGKDPDPDPSLWLTDPEADPGGPKSYGSYGPGSGTLEIIPDKFRALSLILYGSARMNGFKLGREKRTCSYSTEEIMRGGGRG
jgi:hypothetical protein